jgi:KRAB domain-containing zinc finger protein
VEYFSHMKEFHGYKREANSSRKIKGEGYGHVFFSFEQKGPLWKSCTYCEEKPKFPKAHLTLVHREEVLSNHPEIELNKPCPECDEMFYNIVDLDKHSRYTHGKSIRTYKCKFCALEFSDKNLKVQHYKKDHKDQMEAAGMPGIKNIPCPYCEIKLESKMYLKKHIFSKHTDKKSLHPELVPEHSCEICSQTFLYIGDKNAHMRLKHSEDSKCNICGKCYFNYQSLKKHHEAAHDSSVHMCDICSKEYKTKASLKLHIKTHSPSKGKSFKFKCDQCKEGKYQTEEALKQHMLDNHSGKQYICSQCPAVNRTATGRRLHELRMHSEKTVKCDHCDLMFARECDKKVHDRSTHIKKKDKLCPHCGEAFFFQISFEAHVKRHTDDRQFACDVCGKAFLLQRDLNTHILSHSKSFECDQCGKTFGRKTILREHMKSMHEA